MQGLVHPRGGGTAVTLCKLKNMHIPAAQQSNWYMYHGQKELVATLAAKLTKNLIQDEKMLAIPQKLIISRSYELNVHFTFFA